MSKADLIECFAVSPIRQGGKKKVDCMVYLTQEQYDSLSKLNPSPVRKLQQLQPNDDDAGGEGGDGAGTATETTKTKKPGGKATKPAGD